VETGWDAAVLQNTFCSSHHPFRRYASKYIFYTETQILVWTLIRFHCQTVLLRNEVSACRSHEPVGKSCLESLSGRFNLYFRAFWIVIPGFISENNIYFFTPIIFNLSQAFVTPTDSVMPFYRHCCISHSFINEMHEESSFQNDVGQHHCVCCQYRVRALSIHF
jgi:hypothetical protein